jgi:hypothetical protein
MNRFEQRKATSGRVVQAWDHVFKRAVAVKPLPEGISAAGRAEGLIAAWERWYGAPHPGLLKPLSLDLKGKVLVREWVWGFSLLDLLRRRHRLEGPEAVALLEAVAATMDHAKAHSLMDEAGMDKWIAEFTDAGDDGVVVPSLSEPLARWPPWRVRLDPLRIAKLVGSSDQQTFQLPGDEYPGVARAVATALGFLRELSGASMQRTDAPIAALNDEENRVLMAARKPGRYASAAELAKALAAANDVPLPGPGGCMTQTVREYELVFAPAVAGPAGEKLLLELASPGSRGLQLVHRDELRFGRSYTEADLALRFAERSEASVELVKRLSRVHARLQRRGGEIRLLDGGASAPSGNGTFTGEGALTDPAGLLLRQVALVQFGTHWRATLAPVLVPPETVRFRGDPIEAAETERVKADGCWGAVFVVPSPDCRALVETVWLLEEAGFGVDGEGTLLWDWEGLGAAPAAFRVRNGSYYLLNRRLDDAELSADGHPIKPGAGCMLREGMALAIGSDCWRIRIA